MRSGSLILSVIVPVHNGGRVLGRALGALAASDLSRECWELLVVDDASTDDSAAIAAEYADRIVRMPGPPHGPAYARNRGAEMSHGEFLLFVDADVCVHPDALRRVASVLAHRPDVSAVFGSYDDRPAAPGLVSPYRNLLHHYVHQRNGGPAETFWGGCGAVRRDAFLQAGMYDEWRFPRPQIEDIELGYRLRAVGHQILLCPEIQGTHLKRWTLREVIRTDLRDRGVPWMRLLIRDSAAMRSRALNLATRERLCATLVWIAIALLPVAALRREPAWLFASLAALVIVVVANLGLYAFFTRCRGLAFALGTVPLHVLYYGLTGCSVLAGWVLHQMVGEPRPDPVVEAYAEVGLEVWPPVPRRPGAPFVAGSPFHRTELRSPALDRGVPHVDRA
ncbi:MAG: glycosyltransferase [Gemmatimonadaceae bacterium]